MDADANANANANANADAGGSTIALHELCSVDLMNKISDYFYQIERIFVRNVRRFYDISWRLILTEIL